MKKRLLLTLCALVFSANLQAESLGRLVFFSNDYCPYCEAFRTEIGGVYTKTTAGKALPMVEVNQFFPDDEFEKLAKRIAFVPTFVVLDNNNHEYARFRGYRDEEWFWAELEEIVEKMRSGL